LYFSTDPYTGKGCEYSIDTQRDLFVALISLYNFGKQHGEVDLSIDEDTEGIEDIDQDEESLEGYMDKTAGSTWMDKKRDQIAAQIWEDYQQYNNKGIALLLEDI
jgi:hypothetical protein